MLSGIMAIFEMALSLTGRSMIPASPDAYFEDATEKFGYHAFGESV